MNPSYQKAYLNVLFQSLFSFKTFLTKFSKQTLAVMLWFKCVFFPSSRDQAKQVLTLTLLSQCNFLLVVGTDSLI